MRRIVCHKIFLHNNKKVDFQHLLIIKNAHFKIRNYLFIYYANPFAEMVVQCVFTNFCECFQVLL